MANDKRAALSVMASEHRMFRAEVIHFDKWCIIATLISIGSFVVYQFIGPGSISCTIAFTGMFLFLRSWASLMEKLKLLKRLAEMIQSNLEDPQLYKYDAGKLNDGIRALFRRLMEAAFFGAGLVYAGKVIVACTFPQP